MHLERTSPDRRTLAPNEGRLYLTPEEANILGYAATEEVVKLAAETPGLLSPRKISDERRRVVDYTALTGQSDAFSTVVDKERLKEITRLVQHFVGRTALVVH